MKTKYDVARYVTRAIHLSGKSNKQIAKEAGFEGSNIVSMIKKGDTKVPLARVLPFAESLGSDPHELLSLCLEAYQPELHKTLELLTPSVLVSTAELNVIRALRTAARAGAFS